MKAQRVQIDGVEEKNLIVLFNPDGTWELVTTVSAVNNFDRNFAYLDSNGILKKNGNVIGTEDDVVFIGEKFDIRFPSLSQIIRLEK